MSRTPCDWDYVKFFTTKTIECHTQEISFSVWWPLRMLDLDTYIWFCQIEKKLKKKLLEVHMERSAVEQEVVFLFLSLFYGRLWIIYFVVMRRVADILEIIAVVIFPILAMYTAFFLFYLFSSRFTLINPHFNRLPPYSGSQITLIDIWYKWVLNEKRKLRFYHHSYSNVVIYFKRSKAKNAKQN